MVDIFARLEKNAGGPIGQYMKIAHGYFAFPKLEGELGPHMRFRGKMMLNWSLNNYLGLANHPEVREADAKGAAEFGMAAPMGARMMSGQTKYHEQLERELAAFVGKEDAFLLNFGYQGMISIIDCLLSPRALDVVVYDAEAHACIMDGLRLYKGKRFMFAHNDMESLRLQLKHATELADQQGGGVLVITEGVFGMKGDCGKLDEIVALKKEFPFRLLVDDAHGFGTMGPGGRGTAGIVPQRQTKKNKFSVGETIEVMKPDGRNLQARVQGIYNEEGESQDSAPHARQIVYVQLDVETEPWDILRRREAGGRGEPTASSAPDSSAAAM